MSLYNYTVLDNIKSPNITTVQCLLPTHYSSIQYATTYMYKAPTECITELQYRRCGQGKRTVLIHAVCLLRPYLKYYNICSTKGALTDF